MELGAAEVARYGGEVRSARVTGARRAGPGFAVRTADGADSPPAGCCWPAGWSTSCPSCPGWRSAGAGTCCTVPYCHGWEVRDQPIGVLATGPNAIHQALLFRQWSPRVRLLLHTGPEPTDEQWEQLAARGIEVVDGEVVGLEIVDDRLAGVRLATGRVVGCTALVVQPRMIAGHRVARRARAATVEHPLGEQLSADRTGLTAVPGVWVAGNAGN